MIEGKGGTQGGEFCSGMSNYLSVWLSCVLCCVVYGLTDVSTLRLRQLPPALHCRQAEGQKPLHHWDRQRTD